MPIDSFDVAVVGAGLAGLTCARQLQNKYSVVVLEKSRGVGGRVATRRYQNVCFDHGLPWLEDQGEQSQRLIEQLLEQNLLQLWTQTTAFQPPGQRLTARRRYVSPQGMTAIAKWLAAPLDVRYSCRVQSVERSGASTVNWKISFSTSPGEIEAKAVVLAIPAPQATMLLKPDAVPEFAAALRSAVFAPCLTVMAGYLSQPPLSSELFISAVNHSELAGIILDSSKRESPQPVVILHSTPEFARSYLEADDLQPVGKKLLQAALPWLQNPEWFQVHRWRFAFPAHSLNAACLASGDTLVGCGDWCGGKLVESALTSGLAAAQEIEQLLAR